MGEPDKELPPPAPEPDANEVQPTPTGDEMNGEAPTGDAMNGEAPTGDAMNGEGEVGAPDNTNQEMAQAAVTGGEDDSYGFEAGDGVVDDKPGSKVGSVFSFGADAAERSPNGDAQEDDDYCF